MGRTSIIGANFLDRFRSSDYKNSVYAIAEILDNSVDAEAKNIELITITENKKVKEIFFVDNGKGMSEKILSKCVVFSEGTNSSGTKKTGFFGMGLPNSSLSQCRDFSVICEIDGDFRQNRIDFKKMQSNGELYIDDVYEADKKLVNRVRSYTRIKDFKTIIQWTDLDKIDTLNAETLKNTTVIIQWSHEDRYEYYVPTEEEKSDFQKRYQVTPATEESNWTAVIPTSATFRPKAEVDKVVPSVFTATFMPDVLPS